ncbi:hypothetical protein [Pseudochelatococcus contaminans]|uniref:Flagellar protein FliL n=1 Tax=Pseudochelatococcus contaminans TaxID=1538103 RepID=A0A7W5Z0Z2_9HYPH|nr:hypothetical protein [Pseudochelatococcus contaminans]MBB3808001.1 hypothetical protein [Pseudochelatococcus contaminans]
MIRLMFVGLWVCAVTLISSYSVAQWSSSLPAEEPQSAYFEGLEYRKVRAINVPVVTDNEVKGYVVAQFVYTADARTLRELSIPPESLVVDRAFRLIYDDTDRQFDGVNKKNLDKLTTEIKTSVNGVFGAEIVKDVLIEELNYIDKRDILK